MGKVNKSTMNKFDQMWAKSIAATSGDGQKKEQKRFTPGKAQAMVQAAYMDTTKNGNVCVKWELKILTGEDKGRVIKRTHFLEGRTEEETADALVKFKTELAKCGVSETKTITEAIESLEECVLDITVWFSKKKPENYPIAFFNKYIKGPEGAEEEGELATAAAGDDDDIEY
jgi:hypothetical protein